MTLEKTTMTATNNRKNVEANHRMREFADGKTVFWVDFNDRLVDPDTGWTTQELMPDAIHPSDRAYMIWLEALEPFLPPRRKEEYVTPPMPGLHDVTKRKARLRQVISQGGTAQGKEG